MIEILNNLTLWHWLSLGIILVILEIVLGTNFFILWLALSAITVAILLGIFPGLNWKYQWLVFAIESIACLLFWHFYLRKVPITTDRPKLNRRSEQCIGRIVTLKEPIVDGRGRVNIDDSLWRVEGPDLPAGTKIRVESVNGIVLRVKAIGDSHLNN